MQKRILPSTFYHTDDILLLSRLLLGKIVVTHIDNQLTAGMIVETEAYAGVTDKASHAFQGRYTERTRVMYERGGVAYIYVCYGIHYLLNIVTGPEQVPHAVLIRAIEPLVGISVMLKRRRMASCEPRLTGGPGALCQALGITKACNGASLTKAPIWVEDHQVCIANSDILCSPRIGIDYAEECRDLPWRFRLRKSRWTSKAVSSAEKSLAFYKKSGMLNKGCVIKK